MQGVLTRIPGALGILALLLFAAPAIALPAGKIPDVARAALMRGEPQEILVLFDDQAIQAQAAALRKQFKVKTDTNKIQQQKSVAFFALKQRVLAAFPAGGHDLMRNYSHLPLALLRIKSLAALEKFAAHPEVIALYPNERRFPTLAQSLPLIGQPAAAAAGDDGAGATVLVIDSGVNYTRAEFGSCTAPGIPASCKVVYYANNADTSTALDTLGHGTLVSGVVVGVAPGAKLAVFNVFGAGSSATDGDINEAINWGIANQALYNIVAMNLSLGGGPKQTSPCGNKGTNPYVTTFSAAISAGIMPVAASGNEGYTDGMLEPGCTPSAVSVGAVYDANVGQVGYGACTDTTTSANKVTCYSNSAYFLTLLAPGSLIDVAGTINNVGTSFATPHVAGAAAVLRAAYFTETVDETIARMVTTGLVVTDTRNGIITPRINLSAAARPANDAFAKRILLGGASGTVIGYNVLATKEAGEPNHAGNSGGASVWWKWVAPSAGQANFDTHGSVVDTLLAVYSGSAVNALTLIAGNDNDGTANGASGVLFQAQAGVEYHIAVDGANGAANDLALNWSLTAAQADLFVASSAAPEPVTIDTDLTYTLSVSNNGPQTATNVVLSDTLPAGALFISATTGCTHSAGVVTCALGTLANGASSLVNIVIRLSNAGTAINNASVASDLPDPNSANNTDSDTTTVVVAVAAADDGDIPTLPEWGAILMASLLLGAAYRRRG
ncbi:MAG: IPTL-CTERM sorting domain-containing protein [Burkholderiales bacterium]|nr:IPTL-CTERM sorting domain-containing protein [Burkholderiales bacterium]